MALGKELERDSLLFKTGIESIVAKQPAAFKATTPKTISDEILNFCNSIRATNDPEYVKVRPHEFAVSNRCHTNVPTYIKEHGGTKAYGWIIWEARYWIEAECHCNWVDPNGKKIDITPKNDGEKIILFLPDDSVKWTGHMILPHRWPKADDRFLAKWASFLKQRDIILSKYRVDKPLSWVDEQKAGQLQNDANIALANFVRQLKQREKNRANKKRKKR